MQIYADDAFIQKKGKSRNTKMKPNFMDVSKIAIEFSETDVKQ